MSLTLIAILILSAWVILIVGAGLLMALRPGGEGVRLSSTGVGAATSAGQTSATASTVSARGERDEILLGGDAEVLGNVRGRVQMVYMRADDRRVEAVELGGGLIESEPVPAAAIVSADGQVLHLSEGWQPIDVEGLVNLASLRRNLRAVGSDGKGLGKLRLVCFDRGSRTVTDLVVAERGASMHLLPMQRVTEIGPERILTDVGAADRQTLQPFATDWDLRQSIDELIDLDSELRPLRRSLDIEVEDQRLRVRGYAADQAQAERIGQLLRFVPGVLGVDLQLWTDEQLARSVEAALARDPATARAQAQVTARLGVIDITGEAPDRSAMKRIDAVARQVDGVQVVHNMVAVRPIQATA